MIIYKHLAIIMAYITIAPVCIVMFACTEGTSTGRLSIKDSEKVIQELRDSGQTARKNSRFDEAIQLHTRELKIAQKIGSITDQVKALNNIGTNYRRMGMLEDASRYHLEALTLTMKEDDQSDKTVIKNRLKYGALCCPQPGRQHLPSGTGRRETAQQQTGAGHQPG